MKRDVKGRMKREICHKHWGDAALFGESVYNHETSRIYWCALTIVHGQGAIPALNLGGTDDRNYPNIIRSGEIMNPLGLK